MRKNLPHYTRLPAPPAKLLDMLNACRTTRIYCLENCPPGRRTRPENRVKFASEAEAIAAGYRACKVCRPDIYAEPWQPRRARLALKARV